MNTELLLKIEQPFLRKFPEFRVGDTIAVKTKFTEGKKSRVQTFKGIVLAIKGSGIRKTFTIRKISHGVGVEKIIPLHSPTIEKIEVLKHGKVTKAKIYYMRKRIGKRALKIAEGVFVPETGAAEDEVAATAEKAAETQTVSKSEEKK